MKKKAVLLLIVLIFIGTGAFGVDITQFGYKVISTFEEQGTTIYVVEDTAGARFEFIGTDITEKQAELLIKLRKEFEGLKYIQIKSTRISMAESQIDALIVPSSFTYKGEDFTQFLPSGMQFYFETYLEYDFRMLIDKLFVRLKGQFFDESALAERMVEAVSDPVKFIQTHDPEYMIKKFIALEETLEQLKAADFEAGERINALEKENEGLRTELTQLKRAAALVSSHGAFGRIKEMDPSVVDKVVAMKQADSGLTVDAAVAAMKAEGVKISKDQVYIIFTLFF